jgi:hypothetical protein
VALDFKRAGTDGGAFASFPGRLKREEERHGRNQQPHPSRADDARSR